MAINGITTLIALIVLIILTYFISELHQNKEMMWYGALKLISNFFLIEWFYKGIENFKFITTRTIIVKCFFVVSVFIFVRERTDYRTYYLLSVLMITGNAIINAIFSSRFVNFKLRLIKLREYTRSFFILGLYFFLTSLFTTFNIVYLGFITNDTQVGYYTTATKLYSILLALYSGVTTVLMPRMSHLLSQNKMDEFKVLVGKSTSLLFSFSLPLIIFCIIFAPQIILLISGPGYEGAVTPMRIIMPLMLVIGYEQIQVVQCLMPLKQDKTVMINSGIGAVIGVALNLILVPRLASVGSAITWAIAEFSILILSQIVLQRLYHFNFPINRLVKTIASYIPLIILLLLLNYLGSSLTYWQTLIIGGGISGIYFLLIELLILKENFILDLVRKVIKPISI